MRSQSRAGFTLIELMVAMALTMLIMVILSQAFVIALDTFVGLKAIGDMQSNLRTAKVLLTDDLSQDHLEGDLKLSDITYNGTPRIVGQKPLAGFFAVLQASAAKPASADIAQPDSYVNEGLDSYGLNSFRATNHVLYMTVKRKGNRAENFFTAIPATAVAPTFFGQATSYGMTSTTLAPATYADPGAFSSQWAEVIYYLVKTGTTEEPNNPLSTLGIPLHSLYRAQFAMVTDGTGLNGQNIASSNLASFQGISCGATGATGGLEFYSPADAAALKRVFPDLSAFNNADTRLFKAGLRETLVLQNVTSFHIQVMPNTQLAFRDVTIGSGGGVYDTARLGATGNNFGLKGIQVSLRVFEYKTRQTRQLTIVQDL